MLRTKLFIPQTPSGVIDRSRLVERLNRGLAGKLNLVMAPAGYGKTTLVTTWLHQLGNQPNRPQIAWLSLDENDNDIRRFFTHFVAAFCQLDDAFSTVQETFLQNSGSEIAMLALITELLNQVALYDKSIILVLDDYHEISEAEIHEALSFWLDNQPPNFHLVITSRTEPPLPLPRMRVRRQVTEITTETLRFSRAETADFLNIHMRLNLAAEDIAQLEQITEGWVASLQLAALSLQDSSNPSTFIQTFKGDNRYIVDYLANEVLYRQPEQIRSFLLQTAVLDRFNVQLCNAVTQQEDSQQILDTLDQARLFLIPLDDQRHWYRYHHLFADYLQAELMRTAPETASVYHERASHWYEQNDLPAEAIHHAFATGNQQLAADLLAANARKIHWVQGDIHRLWSWIQRLPDPIVQQTPQLLITTARLKMELFADYTPQIDATLQKASDLIDAAKEREPTEAEINMAAEIAITRASLARYRGNLATATDYGKEAVASANKSDNRIIRVAARGTLNAMYYLAGNISQFLALSQPQLASMALDRPIQNYARYNFLSYVIDALRLHGELGQAEHLLQQLEPHLRQRQSVGSATVSLVWAEIRRERNELDLALNIVRPALEKLKPVPAMALVVQAGTITLARILQAQGKESDALQLLTGTKQSVHITNNYSPAARLPAMIAWLHLQQGQLAQAQAWQQANGLQANDVPDYLREIDYLVLVRLLLAEGKAKAALSLLARLETAVTENGRFARLIEIQILQAIAQQKQGNQQGNHPQALACLTKAIELAEPARFMRVFIDEGDILIPLLNQIAASHIAASYIQQLLPHFSTNETIKPQTQTTISPKPLLKTSTTDILLSPLTDRELTTLRYLSTELSIPGIAEQLIVAPSTVRTYVKNIYSKLDVHSRMEAVNRGRALGLIR
ncbi:MAG: LuxR C-terminal-related transcriptional regulator [Chloroflexota bacterium]